MFVFVVVVVVVYCLFGFLFVCFCRLLYARGARFTKWRAVCHIKDSGTPTHLAIDQNATSFFLKAFFSSLAWCAPVPLLNLSMRATVARVTVRVMQATHSLGHVSECGGDCLRARPLCLTPSSRLRTAAVPKSIPQVVKAV